MNSLKTLLALSFCAALAACSGGNDDDDDDITTTPANDDDDDSVPSSDDDDDDVTSNDDDSANDDDTTDPVLVTRNLAVSDTIRFTWSEHEDDPLGTPSFSVETLPGPLAYLEEEGWVALSDRIVALPEGQAFPLGASLEFDLPAGMADGLGELLTLLSVRQEDAAGTVTLLAVKPEEGRGLVANVEHFTFFILGFPFDIANGPEGVGWLSARCAEGIEEACRALRAATCGNGTVDAPQEACDGDAPCTNGCYSGASACLENCTLAAACDIGAQACGNGVTEGCELCDDGDTNPCTAACNADCSGPGTAAVCGDGQLQCGESCDDGDTDACTADCNAGCTGPGITPSCGDSVAECGEVCDEGPLNGQPGHCNAGCDGTVATVCGNGVTEPGEACDGETGVPCTDDATGYAGGKKCKDDCSGMTECFLFESCGDGTVNGNEACDAKSLCCLADCTGGKAVGAVCRTAAGVCDQAETCDGAVVACPSDLKSTAVCRASTSSCDTSESCNGNSNGCPVDDPSCNDANCQSGACQCVAGNCRVSFAADVLPIFTNPAVNPNACVNCHIGGATAGLNLDSHANAMLGSTNGPVIVAGDPDNSPLYRKVNCWGQPSGYCINDNPMPNGGPELSADQKQIIHDWIKQGALDN